MEGAVGIDVPHGRKHLGHAKGLRPLSTDHDHDLEPLVPDCAIEKRVSIQCLQGLQGKGIPLAVVCGHRQQLFSGDRCVFFQSIEHVHVQQAVIGLLFVLEKEHDVDLVVELGELLVGHTADLDHRRLEQVACQHLDAAQRTPRCGQDDRVDGNAGSGQVGRVGETLLPGGAGDGRRTEVHRDVVPEQFIEHGLHPSDLSRAALLGQGKDVPALAQAIVKDVGHRGMAADAVDRPYVDVVPGIDHRRDQVHHQVGRAAGGAVDAHRITKVAADQAAHAVFRPVHIGEQRVYGPVDARRVGRLDQQLDSGMG